MNNQIIKECIKKIEDIKDIKQFKDIIQELEELNFNEEELTLVFEKLVKDTRLCKAFIIYCKKNNLIKYYNLMFKVLDKNIKNNKGLDRYYIEFTFNIFKEDKEKAEILLDYYKNINHISNRETLENVQAIIKLKLQEKLSDNYVNQVIKDISINQNNYLAAVVKNLYRKSIVLDVNLVIFIINNDIKEFYMEEEFINLIEKNKKLIKSKVNKNIDKIEEFIEMKKKIENF